MKQLVFTIIILLSAVCPASLASCDNKPNYIPNNYTVVSCGRYSGIYLESYVVKDKNTNKLGAYTFWAETNSDPSLFVNPSTKYNKMMASVIYDDVVPVKDGFIVKKNNKYGFIHVDKGMIFDVIYDKIYLSNDRKEIYAQTGSTVIKQDNPNNIAETADTVMFNVFIRPLFFWLEPALPTR